jgi:tetratricopeptide (TPR) repeat protein
MKKSFVLFLVLLSITFESLAQDYTEKAVQVISPETFVLNSENNALFSDGVNKIVYSIKLPANTIRWFYVYSASRNKEKIQDVKNSSKLFSTLSKAIDNGGTTAAAISIISTPPGYDYCNVYLLSSNKDASTFKNTNDQFYHFSDCSRKNLSSGKVEVSASYSVIGTQYLGFQNPSSAFALNCYLEVVAIVSEEKVVVKTDDQSKGVLYGNLGWKAFENKDIDKCLELSLKALQFDPSLAYVKFNIALVYLVKGDSKSTDAYIDGIVKAKKTNDALHWLKAALQDINDYEKSNGNIRDSDLIKMLLNDEIRNY